MCVLLSAISAAVMLLSPISYSEARAGREHRETSETRPSRPHQPAPSKGTGQYGRWTCSASGSTFMNNERVSASGRMAFTEADARREALMACTAAHLVGCSVNGCSSEPTR